MLAPEITTSQQLRALERVWGNWLNSLDPWERAFVLQNELEFHDRFFSGEWGWAQLTQAIREYFS